MEIALGAFIAVVSGAASEWIRGWLERNRRIADRKSDFRHRTAIELQETLQLLFEDVMQIHEGMERQYREVKQWGYSDVSQEVADLESVRKSRVLMLMERLDDPALRTEIGGMLQDSLAMYTAFTRDEGRQAKDKFAAHWNSVNKALGKAIRESWPD